MSAGYPSERLDRGPGRLDSSGLAGGVFASRYLSSVLFGLTPRDPTVQAPGVILIVAVAAAAALLPARTAARTDPLVALRRE